MLFTYHKTVIYIIPSSKSFIHFVQSFKGVEIFIQSIDCDLLVHLDQGCPTFSDRGPLKGNIPWRGRIVNFSLSWGPQHQYCSNYFIPNSYES